MLIQQIPDLVPMSLEGSVKEFVPEPTLVETQSLLRVWNNAKQTGPTSQSGLPKRDALRLQDLKHILPNIFILDVLEGGKDFRVRLCGTGVQYLMGRDLTNVRLSDLSDAAWRRPIYQRAVESEAPAYCRIALGPTESPLAVVEDAFLPVCDRDGVFTMLFCCFGLIDGDEYLTRIMAGRRSL